MKCLKLSLLIFLTACNSQPASYSPARLTAGTAEITVYRPAAFTWWSRSPDIEMNGQTVTALKNGAYYTKVASAGEITIATSMWSMPGTSKITLTAKQGTRYFVRMSPQDSKAFAVAEFGPLGLAGVEAVSNHAGPFALELVSPDTAENEIAVMAAGK